MAAASAPDEIVARHVASTRLEALALFVPVQARGASYGGAADPLLDDVVDILHLCQTADEETTVLTGVCTKLRGRLRAAAVAFLAREAAAWVTIVADGGRIDPEIAERASSAGIVISPHRRGDRIEAAAEPKPFS